MFSVEIKEGATKEDAIIAVKKKMDMHIKSMIEALGTDVGRDRIILKCLTCSYVDSTEPEYMVEDLTFFF